MGAGSGWRRRSSLWRRPRAGPGRGDVWTAHIEANVDTSPAVGDGKVFAVSEDTSSGRARVYALDELTGKVDWISSPGHFATHVSSPSFADGRVIVGLGDQTVAS